MRNENTKGLWNAIKKMGKFSDSYYDKNIEWDMKNKLGLNKNESLQELSPEVVFNTFFEVLSPLSIMYEDILCLFEHCKASKSSRNIEIEFQSGKTSFVIFNVRHFIEAKSKFDNVKICVKKILVNENRIQRIWSLRSGENFCQTEEIKNAIFHKWADEYCNNKDRWPEVLLDFKELAKDLPITELLVKGFECWQALFDFYRLIDRKNWLDHIDEYSELERELLWAESDHCLLSILYNLYYYAEGYLTFSESRKEDIINQLTEFLEAFHFTDQYVEKNIQVWQEFLKLPVWEKRHEVYSIWIFTQIIAAFPRECVTFWIKDETLIFPFSGARLASIKLNNKVFDVWTELRTNAMITPIGKGRKKAIQPDYSIVCGDENNIQDTVVVVECKQYKKANKKNFSEAIIDYTLNRPNAKVLLVDYGKVNPERIYIAAKKISRDRYNLFSKFRPQNENVAKFSKIISKFLFQYANFFELDQNFSMKIVLLWDGRPEMQDYDLYLNFINDDELQELSYHTENIDGSEYSGDIRKSPGEEWIKVEKWKDGIYDIWVNNYSKEIDFKNGDPTILVKIENMAQIIEIKAPNSDSKKLNWWHVLKINTQLNFGYIINQMETEMKIEKFF